MCKIVCFYFFHKISFFLSLISNLFHYFNHRIYFPHSDRRKHPPILFLTPPQGRSWKRIQTKVSLNVSKLSFDFLSTGEIFSLCHQSHIKDLQERECFIKCFYLIWTLEVIGLSFDYWTKYLFRLF